MNKAIISLLLFSAICYSQNNSVDLTKNVLGVISSNEGIILVLEDEYLFLGGNDQLTDYYRTIYNDSTIVNPNTEIKNDFGLNFIPYIASPIEIYNQLDFEQPLNLGMLIQFSKSGSFDFSQYGKSIIDVLRQEQ